MQAAMEPYVISTETAKSRKGLRFSNMCTKKGKRMYNPMITGINHSVGFKKQPVMYNDSKDGKTPEHIHPNNVQ
jgi:hypothetical protein